MAFAPEVQPAKTVQGSGVLAITEFSYRSVGGKRGESRGVPSEDIKCYG